MKIYTQREVAALFRVTVRTIERMRARYRKDGRQFGVKVGGQVRFTQEHIDLVLKPQGALSVPNREPPPAATPPIRTAAMREAALRGREIARRLNEKERFKNDPMELARRRGCALGRKVAAIDAARRAKGSKG